MPTQTRNTDRLVSARDELRRVADLLDAVIESKKSQTDVGAELSLTVQMMQYNLVRDFGPYIKTQTLALEDLKQDLERTRTPGDRLIMAIFRHQTESDDPDALVILPDYDAETLWSLAESRLKPNEYLVLKYITGLETGEPLSVAEAGRRMHTSRERARQHKAHALHKLRHPDVLNQIFPAMSVTMLDCVDAMRRASERAVKIYNAALERYEARHDLLAAARALDEDDINSATKLAPDFVRNANPTPGVRLIDINDAGMSRRLYNVLTKAGIRTLDQVLTKSDADLLALRNMGRGSAHELREILKIYLGVDRPGLEI